MFASKCSGLQMHALQRNSSSLYQAYRHIKSGFYDNSAGNCSELMRTRIGLFPFPLSILLRVAGSKAANICAERTTEMVMLSLKVHRKMLILVWERYSKLVAKMSEWSFNYNEPDSLQCQKKLLQNSSVCIRCMF